MSAASASRAGLRQRPTPATVARNEPAPPAEDAPQTAEAQQSDGPYGKTPDGKVFRIPQTHNMLSSLFDPRLPKSHVDILTLTLLALQVVLYFSLPIKWSRCFFLVYFALWRLAYNAGLGFVLRKQSETKWIVKTVVRKGWMDAARRPKIRRWIVGELQAKMGKDYNFESVPVEFNVWIMFRHFVDVILLNDFLSYFFMAVSFTQIPPGHSTLFHILRFVGGVTLILFNIWVKVDAHRIVKDFAWYWGDAFFLSLQNLVFDGVFEFAPHPMYSVGYAGYYGLSLIVASETVLFVSLAAHFCQFGFLAYFENPHIERTYGERKPLAARMPIPDPISSIHRPSEEPTRARSHSQAVSFDEELAPTPALTDASADTDADNDDDLSDQETEARCSSPDSPIRKTRSYSTSSASGRNEAAGPITRHDLDNRYFRQDLIVLKNFDIFRNRDLAFALLAFYGSLAMILPPMSRNKQIGLAFANALAWRVFHTFGLGLALKAQSESKWIVRHFLKHYHYEGSAGPVEDAFDNWKATYNLSLCMSYASFGALAWKCYTIPADWTVGTQLVRHTLGLLLVALHIWAAQSTFEVLGPFGWFYGDFFIQDYPLELYYTGIFRFLNNPERSMGGAAFMGLVLICGSKVLLMQAVVSVLAHWWFLSVVENPHMQKLYGDTVRRDAGVTKTLRNVAARNAHVFGGVSRGVKEVHGTFEKVLEETADAVEDFLNKSGPRFQGYVNDTKILLKQSGERFVISRVAADLDKFDRTRYSLSLRPSTYRPTVPRASTSSAPPQFHLGEAITVDWTAPENHSRRDWIGIYRLDANKSKLVTKVSSQGKWLGVHDDEWDGNVHAGAKETATKVEGQVTFSGKKLPWTTGVYEIRYHHDGKHSVMAIAPPIEIFVERPTDPDDDQCVYETLTSIVAETLAFDPAAIPQSASHLLRKRTQSNVSSPSMRAQKSKSSPSTSPGSTNATDADRAEEQVATASATSPTPSGGPQLSDPDDFVIYSKDEADHIAYAIEEAFGVELASEVVLAAANTSKLTKSIAEARRLLKPKQERREAEGADVH